MAQNPTGKSLFGGSGAGPLTIRELRKAVLDLLAAASPRHLHVANTIGRPSQAGDLERYLRLTFDDAQRALAFAAFEELKREGRIAPSMSDLVDPLNWYVITESGNQERTGVGGWIGTGTVPSAEADDLTGIYRRSAFDRDVEEAVSFARQNGVPVGCLMIDVDYFKTINDSAGHAAGDEALRLIAKRIQDGVAGCGRAYRYGGDEFSAILIGLSGHEAQRVADGIKAAVAALPPVGNQAVAVSVGVATTANLGPDGDGSGLVAEADQALLGAKRERLRPTNPIGIRTNVTVTGLANSERLNGRLSIALVNHAKSIMSDWVVTVWFPKPFIENARSIAALVGETETHYQFRHTSEDHVKGRPLYPDDEPFQVMTLDFFVDEAVHIEKRLFDESVRIIALAGSNREVSEDKFGTLVEDI